MNELEQALRMRWDRDTLLVYADALQSRGDPRGELIALDVEIADRGVTPELATRRRKRLYEWIGGSTILGRPIHEASFRYGFVTDFFATTGIQADAAQYLTALFASPAGPFVRGLTLATTLSSLRGVLAILVAESRPWLERLEVRAVEHGRAVAAPLVTALIAATPRLHTLAVYGEQAFDLFPHPAVRRFETDTDRLALAHTIPHVDTVDLLLEDDADDAVIASSLASIAELRHLDLARNEPHYPPASPPNVDVYPLARWLASDRFATLRMPALRERHQAALLGEIIDLAPRLEVTIARRYHMFDPVIGAVDHPRLHLPPPFAWPPPDQLSSREALTITVPTEEYGDDLSVKQLIDRLEAQWDDLPPNARVAWVEFWAFLTDLPWEDSDGHDVTKPFPVSTLLTAVEPLDDVGVHFEGPGHWAQLAEKLRAAELPPDAVVSIHRYWGW